MDLPSKVLKWMANHAPWDSARQSAFRKFCRRNRGVESRITTRHGFDLIVSVGDYVANWAAVYGVFEPGVTALVKELARTETSLVDVGCNIGYHTCLFGAANPQARILSIDANPEMTRRCERNVQLNGISATVVNCGVADRSGSMTLYCPERKPSLATFGGDPGKGGKIIEYQVPVQPLDSLLEQHRFEEVGLLKVDVEGFEPLVLKSLRRETTLRIRHMILECSRKNFERCGFSLEEICGLDWLGQFDVRVIEDEGKTIPIRSLSALPDDRENVWLKNRAAQ